MTNVQRTSRNQRREKRIVRHIPPPGILSISQRRRRAAHVGFSADDPPHGGIAAQTLSVIHALLAQGPRCPPASPSSGLRTWCFDRRDLEGPPRRGGNRLVRSKASGCCKANFCVYSGRRVASPSPKTS